MTKYYDLFHLYHSSILAVFYLKSDCVLPASKEYNRPIGEITHILLHY